MQTESNLTTHSIFYKEYQGYEFRPLVREAYNLHFHRIHSETSIFYVVKYSDNSISTTTEYQAYINNSEFEYKDSYPFPDCPQHTHFPLMFSWNSAAKFCYRMNTSLPELISRKEQEDLVSALFFDLNPLESPLVPIEAFFIGLRMHKQVNACCCVCQ